jgi:hypothetical protein
LPRIGIVVARVVQGRDELLFWASGQIPAHIEGVKDETATPRQNPYSDSVGYDSR